MTLDNKIHVQLLSDTHGKPIHELIDVDADIVVHAGDFGNGPSMALEAAKWCEFNGIEYVFVLGNHDYYGCYIDPVLNTIKDKGYNFLTGDNEITILGYTFVGGTLFSNFRANRLLYDDPIQLDANRDYAQQGVYDFIAIGSQVGEGYIQTEEYITRHNKEWNHIQRYKNRDDVIVVTHFPPHLCCLDPYWSTHPTGQQLNPFFINDRDVSGFKYIFSGHTHSAIDTIVDGCRVVINPYGYPQEIGVNGFRNKLIIELNEI